MNNKYSILGNFWYRQGPGATTYRQPEPLATPTEVQKHVMTIAEDAGYKQQRWDTTEQFEQFLEQFAVAVARNCIYVAEMQGIQSVRNKYGV